MKAWRKRVDWQRAFPILAILTVGAALFAVSSYQAWQGWQGVHRQLAPYARSWRPRPVPAPAGCDGVPDVTASLAARDIQLLSWQQSGREAGRQTLVLAGTFASLLSWINDWPAVCLQGTCQILQWEKSETGSVVTVEVTTAGMDGQALH